MPSVCCMCHIGLKHPICKLNNLLNSLICESWEHCNSLLITSVGNCKYILILRRLQENSAAALFKRKSLIAFSGFQSVMQQRDGYTSNRHWRRVISHTMTTLFPINIHMYAACLITLLLSTLISFHLQIGLRAAGGAALVRVSFLYL